jgi:hypothetical protein
MEHGKSRRAFGFLVVCAWSMTWWLLNPFLPTREARLAASLWGAAVNAAGIFLAIYCIRSRKEL